jgi:hypothetical protein
MEQPGYIASGKKDIPVRPGTQALLKPYNLKELAAMYGVSARTLNKWLKPFGDQVGKRIGYFYTIPQVRLIFMKLGLPGFWEEG